jgi:hypothetical protein
VVWANARAIGIPSAEFWDMTPKSYLAVQTAYARMNFGGSSAEDEKKQADVEARRIHAKFTVMAAQQRAKERDRTP